MFAISLVFNHRNSNKKNLLMFTSQLCRSRAMSPWENILFPQEAIWDCINLLNFQDLKTNKVSNIIC